MVNIFAFLFCTVILFLTLAEGKPPAVLVAIQVLCILVQVPFIIFYFQGTL